MRNALDLNKTQVYVSFFKKIYFNVHDNKKERNPISRRTRIKKVQSTLCKELGHRWLREVLFLMKKRIDWLSNSSKESETQEVIHIYDII